MKKDKLIVLDMDGVLLNYNEAYARLWEDFFKTKTTYKNKNRFYAYNEYEIYFKSDEEKKEFTKSFNGNFWKNMKPLKGALEACLGFKRLGYEIICVTAAPEEFTKERKENLLDLRFPINDLYAIGSIHNKHLINPKLEIINELKPDIFIDDLLSNFVGLSDQIHKGLIYTQQPDYPDEHLNVKLVNTVHKNLLEVYYAILEYPNLFNCENKFDTKTSKKENSLYIY